MRVFLPSEVQELIDTGSADVKILSTDAVWQGVTNRADSEIFRAVYARAKGARCLSAASLEKLNPLYFYSQKQKLFRKGIFYYEKGTCGFFSQNTAPQKNYARWLAETMDYDCLPRADARADLCAPYEILVYGGGIYASGIAGFSFIRHHAAHWKNKKNCGFLRRSISA